MTLAGMTAWRLKKLLDDKETGCRDIMASVLDEIDKREPGVKAYVHIRDRAELLAEAERIDRRRMKGDPVGVLGGLPVAVKDNICTKGVPTTCASKMLANFIPPYDATIIEKIRNADGIVIGKTNMDEFAMGSSTENSAMHVTYNPHDPERVPGGTSGGSAAAVAAHECILAVGSDTGGSIRQPASYCGVVGFKPTYGRVSRFGLISYGSSLDQIGALAKDVDDAALLMNVLAGYDKKDSTSIEADVPDYTAMPDPDRKFRVGVPGEYFGEGLDGEVRQNVEAAIDLFRKDGHEVFDITLPHTEYAVPAYYIIVCAEASSNLARYDGVKYGFRAENCTEMMEMYLKTRSLGFGPEVKRRIILGTYVLSSGYYDAYYLKAAKVRTLIAGDFENAFKKCDIIVNPVAPTAAFKIGEKVDDPLAMYLQDIYSSTANLVGLPAVSIPCGKTSAGLPVGVQIAARQLDETTVFAAAKCLESKLKS